VVARSWADGKPCVLLMAGQNVLAILESILAVFYEIMYVPYDPAILFCAFILDNFCGSPKETIYKVIYRSIILGCSYLVACLITWE
jgi:hypothetical protein